MKKPLTKTFTRVFAGKHIISSPLSVHVFLVRHIEHPAFNSDIDGFRRVRTVILSEVGNGNGVVLSSAISYTLGVPLAIPA